MELLLIDAIGPFFREHPEGRINWSKVPFARLETDGRLDQARFDRIRDDFRRFVDRAAEMGFNAITLDDVAHLDDWPGYPAALRAKIGDYRERYRELFAIARDRGLRIFLTTDVMYYHPALAQHVGNDHQRIIAFLAAAFARLFHDFPEVDGLILRMGESDGLDVGGDFRSRLVIRTAGQARRYIQGLLPVFEAAGKTMIFRTWSVGVYSVGDLIWNRHTFDRAFGGLQSERLVISLKYGETDFFRFLPLNQLFFHSDHKKIIELQARREYEGFGEYPSFVGEDYEAYHRELAGARNLVGAWIWCQTGGWTRFRRLSLLDEAAVWNDINTYTALRIFRDGWTSAQAVEAFGRARLGDERWQSLPRLLQLSAEVVKGGLYIEEFARRKIFFRRLRLPPLLWVFWDQILINHAVKKVLRHYVRQRDDAVRRAYAALGKIQEMIELARQCGLPEADLQFQYDTFRLLAAARQYFFQDFSPALADQLYALKRYYEERHPHGYRMHINFRQSRLSRMQLRLLIAVMFRYRRGYRLMDKIFTLRMLQLMYPLVRVWRRRWVPEFAHEQAMGLDAVFK